MGPGRSTVLVEGSPSGGKAPGGAVGTADGAGVGPPSTFVDAALAVGVGAPGGAVGVGLAVGDSVGEGVSEGDGVGTALSTTVMVCGALTLLPAASVAVNVRVMISGLAVVPAPPLSVSRTDLVGAPQLSVAVALLALAAGTSLKN